MRWSHNFAYGVGLITTDGNLSKDGRHIDLTSKDTEQLQTFAKILRLKNKIGAKTSSYNPKGKYYHIQFGDVKLYRFLLKIGLMPNKTSILGVLKIPDKYFADFLRGSLDGDGYTYSYWDKRWKSSFMLYTGFTCASKLHLEWIRDNINKLYGIEGKINILRASAFHLIYSKNASILLLRKVYYKKDLPSLSRKRFKIEHALSIIDGSRDAGMVDRHA